jgi:hypothetical protein
MLCCVFTEGGNRHAGTDRKGLYTCRRPWRRRASSGTSRSAACCWAVPATRRACARAPRAWRPRACRAGCWRPARWRAASRRWRPRPRPARSACWSAPIRSWCGAPAKAHGQDWDKGWYPSWCGAKWLPQTWVARCPPGRPCERGACHGRERCADWRIVTMCSAPCAHQR